MKRNFRRLQSGTFDVIVIGGGIVGAGIARDASFRGLSTLLVEKEDFASGTTSRSTRLIHGGLRYLRTLQFKLVRQDLREREVLLNIAPHLVHRLKFVIPRTRGKFFFYMTLPLGLSLYDILAAGRRLPRWRRLSRKQTLEIEPQLAELSGLSGSLQYFDCQAEMMERLCLENVISASEKGACVLNHVTANRLMVESNNVNSIEIQDTLTGQKHVARAKIIVIAAGHYTDSLWKKFGITSAEMLRKTKGIHILTKKLSNNALVLFSKTDGRLLFVVPWGSYSLVGTTDTDFTGDPDCLYATDTDVDYLVSELRYYFPGFSQNDIFYTIAGLRPLVSQGNRVASDTSRTHRIINHEYESGPGGLITVLGGKITAYRAVAEEVTDLVCKKLNLHVPCATAAIPLPGAPSPMPAALSKAAQEYSLPPEIVTHLASIYGSRLYFVLECAARDKSLRQRISNSSRDILAQISHAVQEEEALTISDFLLRRSSLGLGPSQGLDAVEIVSQQMKSLLGWNEIERKQQVDSYLALAALGQRYKTPSMAK